MLWQIENPDGFNVVWQYFGWANQTLAVITLWTITVWMAKEGKPYIAVLIPAVFMTAVCSTFVFVSKQALGLEGYVGYAMGCAVTLMVMVWFFSWKIRYKG